MKPLQIFGCLLLWIVSVTFIGCDKENKHSGGGGTLTSTTVTITNCVPDKDPVNVKDQDSITWAPDVDYQITFLPTTTPSGPKIPTSSASFPVNHGISAPHVIRGPSDCSIAGCYYKYSLTRIVNGVPEKYPCIDPGIRIVPINSGVGHD